MQGGRQFLLKFSSEFIVNRDHWATFPDVHLHRGWKSADANADPWPPGLPLEVGFKGLGFRPSMSTIPRCWSVGLPAKQIAKERETDKTDRQTEETETEIETETEQRIQSSLGRHVLFECNLKLLFRSLLLCCLWIDGIATGNPMLREFFCWGILLMSGCVLLQWSIIYGWRCLNPEP
jgi:hypothetical protein